MRRSTFYSVYSDVASPNWVEEYFQKCECLQFMPDPNDPNKCGCGREKVAHEQMPNNPLGVWSWRKHSVAFPTDAYGAVEFQTGVHAHYLRMSPSAVPDDIVRLLVDQWGADPPKLIISIHGGMSNFDLAPRIKRAFRRSLQRMAAVPGCWIITSGLNSGAAKYVGDALTAGILRRNRTVVLGIAPWGVVAGRNKLMLRNGDVQYYPPATAPGATVLNPNHSFFLLVDDGTVGRYGNELQWRKDFEKKLSTPNRDSTMTSAPLIAVFLEGGCHCIRIAAEYLTSEVETPIVLVADSGRASDILCMAMNLTDANINPQTATDKTYSNAAMSETDLTLISASIQQAFGTMYNRNRVTLNEVVLCTKRRKSVTIWSADEASTSHNAATSDELDVCILGALLKTKKRTAPEQLRLALAWNRVDLANSQIFKDGQSWPEGALNEAMLEALAMDRVDFVKLLLDQGVDMTEVLTYHRLEKLYNVKHADVWRFRDIARLLLKRQQFMGKMTLAEVGATIDVLMGFGYRSNYKSRGRILNENSQQERKKSILAFRSKRPSVEIPGGLADRFRYPFSELFIWAVLMQRQSMAHLMCSRGEEMLAKCLVGCKLYRAMATFLHDDVISEIYVQLRKNAKEFSNLAVELLEKCRQLDEVMAQRLLTYELRNFSAKTCLSLAVSASVKHFVANPCCQDLLDVLWIGGLRTRSARPWKVLLGLICPPFAIYGLKYLTVEELNLQPKTEAELQDRSSESEEHTGSGSASPAHGEIPEEQFMGRVSQYYYATGGSFRSNQRPRMSTARMSTTRLSIQPNENPMLLGSRLRANSGDVRVAQDTELQTISMEQNMPTVTSESSFGSFPAMQAPRPSVMANLDFKAGGTQLSMKTRLYEFYNAPVTKFWLRSIAYAVFMLCFCFTVLTESFLSHAMWPEIYVTIYVATLLIDKIREIVSIDAIGVKSRFDTYFSDRWNLFDAVGIALFLIGITMRWEAPSFEAGRAFWITALAFFIIHLFDIFQANQGIATYVMILMKMLQRMFSFLIILGVVVASYGIVLEATRFPYRKPEWAILKDIWVEPYLNLYGETYHEFVDTGKCDSEDRQSLDREKPPCWCCTWIGPVAQTIYLIVANVTMLNLQVAVFNSVYEKVSNVSQVLIRFERYRLIVDYQLMPILPPPFVIFSHIYQLARTVIKHLRGKRRQTRDPGLLKVVLSEADIGALHDFEEQAVDELLEQRESEASKPSTDEQMRATTERMEAVQAAVEQIVQKQAAVLNSMRDIEYRLLGGQKAEIPASTTAAAENLSERFSSTPAASGRAEESARRALGSRLFQRLSIVSTVEEGEEDSEEQGHPPLGNRPSTELLKGMEQTPEDSSSDESSDETLRSGEVEEPTDQVNGETTPGANDDTSSNKS